MTSSNAPNKRPDADTEAGKVVIRKEIDAMEKIFIDQVAQGRDTTSEKVIADFGKGGIVLATEAVEKNMIDNIVGSVAGESIQTAATSGQTQTESQIMDLSELKAKHGAVYDAAVAEGKEQGVLQERDRVGAHLILGKSSGDMDTALAAVESGDEMTATLTAKYLAAGMNKNATVAAAGDNTDAGAALDNVDPKTDAQTQTDAAKLKASVADDVVEMFDYEEEGAK